jgi:type I restriction enzyme S subunit
MNQTATELETVPLSDLLNKADSGTWGEEAAVGEGSPVLRSTNIADNQLSLDEPAWRHLTASHSTDKRLENGDIVVTASSGSTDHIGKCAVFEKQSSDEKNYYFSNFTLRLRPISAKLDSKWLYYWLTSPRGRHEMFRLNNTTTGLRNLNKGAYLSQQIPLPNIEEQRRIVTILEKANVIRRKRQDSKVLWEHMLRSAYISSFGDPVANPKGWPVSEIGKIADMVTGYAFKSTEYVNEGVRLCRGANVMPDLLDWSDVRYWRPDDASIDSRLHLIKDDVVLAMDRPWISTGIKVAQVAEADLPAYLVQRVSRLRGKAGISNAFLFYTLRHPAFTAHCGGLKTETTVPHISPQDIRSFPVPVAPQSVHEEFERLAQHAKQVTKKLELAAKEANNLFNSLVQRAFKGEL